MEPLKNSYLSGIGISLSLHLLLAGACIAYYLLREHTVIEQVFSVSLIHPSELRENKPEENSTPLHPTPKIVKNTQ